MNLKNAKIIQKVKLKSITVRYFYFIKMIKVNLIKILNTNFQIYLKYCE